MRRKMSRKKAERHLKYAREGLNFWRQAYVEHLRDENWKRLDRDGWIGEYEGGNPYREKLAYIRANINEQKDRIAKFQRIVL